MLSLVKQSWVYNPLITPSVEMICGQPHQSEEKIRSWKGKQYRRLNFSYDYISLHSTLYIIYLHVTVYTFVYLYIVFIHHISFYCNLYNINLYIQFTNYKSLYSCLHIMYLHFKICSLYIKYLYITGYVLYIFIL